MSYRAYRPDVLRAVRSGHELLAGFRDTSVQPPISDITRRRGKCSEVPRGEVKSVDLFDNFLRA